MLLADADWLPFLSFSPAAVMLIGILLREVSLLKDKKGKHRRG